MTARVKSWGVGKLSEYPRDRSAPRVSAPRWVWSSRSFATHDMGHSMSQYEVVLCQCGDCMRLCCLRCGLEWSGRQMSIVNALQQHWRRGQVQEATVCGPVWKLGSQKKSWFQMVSVSDGFGTLARWHVGTLAVVQEGLFCVLFSVCFVCSKSAEASYKRWLCPFVSPIARASCLRRGRRFCYVDLSFKSCKKALPILVHCIYSIVRLLPIPFA